MTKKEQKRLYDIEYRAKNKDKLKAYRDANKEALKKYYKEWYNNNKEHVAEWSRDYQSKNREKINKYIFTKYHTDINFKLSKNLRTRINIAIKDNTKSDTLNELLGCSIEELKSHLESQFNSGMSWDNYGLKGWHIDHICQCAEFDMNDPEQQKQCFNYTNLQPLWAKDNLSKNHKLCFSR